MLQGGETIGGTLLAAPSSGRFAAEGVKPGAEVFQIARANAAEPLSIPAAKVVAFRAAQSSRQPREIPAAVWSGVTDGSLVSVQSIAVKGDDVSLIALAAGGTLQTTLAGRDDPDKKVWDAIEFIQPNTKRIAWLSQHKPLGYKHIPFLSISQAAGAESKRPRIAPASGRRYLAPRPGDAQHLACRLRRRRLSQV